MTDLTAAEVQWHDWISDACAAVDAAALTEAIRSTFPGRA